MKRYRFFAVVLALLLLLQGSALAADRTISVKLPTFPVTLNGVRIDSTRSEYPLIVYQDITYIPMTYHGARVLHLKANWYAAEPKGILFVGYSETSESNWTEYPAAQRNRRALEATLPNYQIAVNTLNKNQFLDNSSEQYPLLNFRGVTYFPLTWRFAVDEFGWDYDFDAKTGLAINSCEQFRPELEDDCLANSQPSVALAQKTYIYSTDKSEYVGYPYSNQGDASFIYRQKGEKGVFFDATKLFSDGEYLFNRQLDQAGNIARSESVPTLKGGVLTISAVWTDMNGRQTVSLKIDLRNGTLIP